MTAPNPYSAPNPYAAPQSDGLSPTADSGELWDASTGQRFGTFIIDYIGVVCLAIGVGVVMALAGSMDAVDQTPDYLFGVTVMSLYYIGFEGLLGRTPGKMLLGTRVVQAEGGRPSLLQIVGRSFIRFVPFEAFSALGGGRMWHDSWSGTRVITTRGPG